MKSLNELIKTIETLRSPQGCPWDKEQTFKTLIPCIIEECYELVEAIESDDSEHIIEECGDVLLQVVMIATIANETQLFSLQSIAEHVNTKMIKRHPHVFKHTTIKTSKDVLQQWESIKQKEKPSQSNMDNIPPLPALVKAEKIQKKAAQDGFDWNHTHDAIKKIKEEINEFNHELKQNHNQDTLEEEAGDLLFSIINVLRKENINPETALRKANHKFISRYKTMESLSPNFKSLSLEKKEVLWKKAKQLTQSK
ncbi:nucleoside triphosphate pyrophosphohydrolase [bacterium]|nr:nucleoside triphosphate pyrophosphohydrolase [bacterium]|tara:strand:- start:283 stop:1044 length:762 start_codon:yes stop_codon:yes gene_type:complete